ncbi:MAG TPA: hypothetical protein VIL14_03955, partial [Nitrososphaeraceae archaeon]
TKEFGKNPFTLNLASNSPNELHTGETSPTGTPKAEERDDDIYTKENKYMDNIKKRSLFLIYFWLLDLVYIVKEKILYKISDFFYKPTSFE